MYFQHIHRAPPPRNNWTNNPYPRPRGHEIHNIGLQAYMFILTIHLLYLQWSIFSQFLQNFILHPNHIQALVFGLRISHFRQRWLVTAEISFFNDNSLGSLGFFVYCLGKLFSQ